MLGTLGDATAGHGLALRQGAGGGRCHFWHLDVSSGWAINVKGAWLCTQSFPVVLPEP